MSVVVHDLTKKIQHQSLVDKLNFKAEKGQILGLLGPNGAGKSTTIRMLTGYIPASVGEIYICGTSLQKEPLIAKSQIGYLPENNPLYFSMYVREYLKFRASMQKLQAQKTRTRCDDVIHLCDLSTMQHKKIGALSKGYRQRVGLAQALLHDPPVLILDEPTTGLDPNQIYAFRELIAKLKADKTIILSTHIMQEVEAVCDQVVIIQKGKLYLTASLVDLANKSTDEFIIVCREPIPTDQLKTLPGLKKWTLLNPYTCKLYSQDTANLYAAILAFIAKNKLTLQRLEQKKETLENIFAQL